MTDDERRAERPVRFPRLPALLLKRLLPDADGDEVLRDMAEEHAERFHSSGAFAAWRWAWGQALSSLPGLLRLGWWRGWSGFEPTANWMHPGGAVLESWAMDTRYSLRRLWHRPRYGTLTVLTLALGVAGVAAAFGVSRQLLLEPLPVASEEEVAVFWADASWSEAEFAHVQPALEAFRGVAAYRHADATLQQGDAPARLIRAISTTAELFGVLATSPALGTGFRPEDERPGAEPTIVLSHSLWRDLGGRPSIVGERIEVAGEPRTVVGVMPSGFWFPDPTVQAWLSEEVDPENGVGNYTLVGRLPPGSGVDDMGGVLDRITGLLGSRFDYPEQWDMTVGAHLTPLRDYLVGPIRPALLALLGAMSLILLIASVNVAVLMLGQTESRGAELAVRGALGASRARILRQLVVESLVIGALAGVAGAALALVGFRSLTAALPLGALADTASVDWSLFLAAIAVAAAAATAVAMAPAFSIFRNDLQASLTRTRTGGIGGGSRHLESALVVGQVALVLLLVSGAALLVRSVDNLRAIDPGVDLEGVAVIDVVMPTAVDPARRPQVVRDLVEAVDAVPGVDHAAATQKLPLRGSGDNWGIGIEGRPDLESTTTAFRVVTPDYFETLGIPVLAGRALRSTDRDGDVEEGVVVVNEALVERYFAGENPLGRRISFGSRWDRIVGVVENVAEEELSSGPVPARYMVYEQVPLLLPSQTLVLRTRGELPARAVLDPARRAIHTAAPGVALAQLTTMENVFDRSLGPARQVMSLLALLAGLALVLGIVGVYGVVSHVVARRRRDWGIRIALGLAPRRVVGRIIGRSGLLVGIGVALGLLAFLGLARFLATFLYGIGVADPISLVVAISILLGTGLLAAYVPARRASRIDPARVLREQ